MWRRRTDAFLLGICLWGGAAPATQEGMRLVPVTALFQSEQENGSRIPKSKEKRNLREGSWIRVGGFTNAQFLYGQLQILERGKVAGYLYPSPKQQIYVQGEIIRSGIFRVFDAQGTLYRLVTMEKR